MEAVHLRNSVNIIKRIVEKAVVNVLKYSDDRIPVLPFTKGKDWDYQSGFPNKAFSVLKKKKELGDYKNSKDIADKLAQYIVENNKGVIHSAESSDRGFLLMRLDDSYLLQEINSLVGMTQIRVEPPKDVLKIVVDFSSPNIAKEMHVGHLRSTIIGESVCRLFEYLGHNVERVNHVGDWGTQFGMLIAHMMDSYPNYLDSQPDLKDLETFYKQSKKRFEAEPEFKKRAQENVVKLQQGDKEFLKAWEILCELSRTFFRKIYARLDITNNEYGESFYNAMIPSVIQELEEKNLIKLDDGAKCLFVPKKKVPLMVVKSDGGYNYDTTDLAAARFRLIEWKADRVVYLTDVGQFPHFDLIFRASEMAGWHCPPKTRMEHMGFGIVKGEDGTRIKTRSGKSVKLMDLLDEATQRAKKQLQERFSTDSEKDKKTNLDEKDIDNAAEVLGIAAIKYYDLRQNRIQDYKFSFDAMLNQKGDTAVYLMYSYIRICSIIRKSGLSEEDLKCKEFKFSHEAERNLARQMIKFVESLDTAQEKLQLNKICDFLYTMAVRVAESYCQYKVIGNEHTESRILLMLSVKKMMELCFHLLGIKTIDRI